jgi:hypothetical protein
MDLLTMPADPAKGIHSRPRQFVRCNSSSFSRRCYIGAARCSWDATARDRMDTRFANRIRDSYPARQRRAPIGTRESLLQLKLAVPK